MSENKVAILYHNFYSLKGLEDIRIRLDKLIDTEVLLLASVADKFFYKTKIYSRERENIVKASNIGKDIGGKLLLLDLFLKKYSHFPFILFLHDKRSYQKYSGNYEKEKLFRIIEPAVLSKALQIYSENKAVGIIASKDCIKNEYIKSIDDFKTLNSPVLKKLQDEYEIYTEDFSFVAGTMFLIRSSILVDFFQRYSPLKVRATLEPGNVLDDVEGTVTHSWERLLCWLATSKGYRIEGI